MKLSNFFKYTVIILINYFVVFFFVYILSGFLLIKGITPNLKLITEYQRNFYIHGGIRNIWQSHKECVDFDEETIFIPKSTACKFKNLEFYMSYL